MIFSAEYLATIRKSLEDQRDQHSNGYQQAIGALQLLDHLELLKEPEAITEAQLETMLDSKIQSIEPVGPDDEG